MTAGEEDSLSDHAAAGKQTGTADKLKTRILILFLFIAKAQDAS